MKINGNLAKRILFQFHKQQNIKKPGSVHAVYLLSGFLAPSNPAAPARNGSVDGEDAYMQSSPFMSSSAPQNENDEEPKALRGIAMCREEHLEGETYLRVPVVE
ncbi:MAG: hypothetical protein Q9170_001206 [Blastenia crenularia]